MIVTTLHTRINGGLYKIAMISLGLLLVSACMNIWLALTPKITHGTCGSYNSYADILVAFHNGNRGLDGDGDGVPCENRK